MSETGETSAPTASKEPAHWPLVTLLLGSGTIHLAAPQLYEGMIPKSLGAPRPWVTWSGVVELGIGAALLSRRTRRPAALAAAALFAGVFPGNVTMAAKALRSSRASTAWKAATLARLPLQVPMVTQSLKVARAQKPSQRG
ncbi:hypothetical protein ACIB24_19210 [Spongisporangium articulatum]|uniref:DoxX family protein n=1 Tax=Spongisporangium articulatum TaxID=3362603 RepID=A0ABW8AS26_9ACTN